MIRVTRHGNWLHISTPSGGVSIHENVSSNGKEPFEFLVLYELADYLEKQAAAPVFITDGDPTWRHGTKSYTVTVENGSVQIMVMDGAHVEFIGEAKAYKASTPAAPGIDLTALRDYQACFTIPGIMRRGKFVPIEKEQPTSHGAGVSE